MKRNNIFMWAYIFFMFICCFLRIGTDFTMWSPIVIAVTISSIFFSLEDLLASISATYAKTNSVRRYCVAEIRKLLDEDREAENRIIEKYIQYKGTNINIEKDIPHWKNLKKYNAEVLGHVIDIERGCASEKKIQKRYQKAATIVSFLGFFCLFLTMSFIAYFPISVKFQEIITVFSFGIILVTQQMNNITCENIKEQEQATEDLLRKYKAAVDDTKEFEKNSYNMLEQEKCMKSNEDII